MTPQGAHPDAQQQQEAAPTSGRKPPAPRRRRWLVALGVVAGGVVLALVSALAALAWVALHPAGSAWLLARVPGLTVVAPQGTLLGDFAAERFELAWPNAAGSSDRVRIAGLQWRGLALARAASPAAWLRIDLQHLQADRVDLLIAPSATPATPPASLRLPVEVDLRELAVAEVHATALGEQPLRELRVRLHLGADAAHRIDELAFAWDRIVARGKAQIAAQAPYDLGLQFELQSQAGAAAPAMPFVASVTVGGPLERLAVQATLRGTGPGAPSLDLAAGVLPFAAWPLASLELQTRGLDLAALHSSAPATAISGTASVQSQAADRPAVVAVELANARAGRVDAGLLPLRSMSADLRARPDDPQSIEVRAFTLELGTAAERGGRVRGSGSASPRQTALATRLEGILPRVLDARAPALRLSGSAQLDVDASGDERPAQFALRGSLTGSLPVGGRERPVQLAVDAAGTTQDLRLRRAELRGDGTARVAASGRARRQAGGSWQLAGDATIADFDPLQWWPGREGSAWHKGPHRLNAALAFDGTLPALALPQLARARGQASLRVTDSLLAGAPLAGEASLRGAGEGLAVVASLGIAGADLALRGTLAPDAAADHWEIEARSGDLSRWAPLLALVPAPAALAGLAGKLDAQARVDGRWPALTSSGKIALAGARTATLQLAGATLRWNASTQSPRAPLDLLAEIEQFGDGTRTLDRARLAVKGTLAEHRIELDAVVAAQPPQWVDLLHGVRSRPGVGTRAELRAAGSLEFDPLWQQPLRWQGKLEQVGTRRGGTPEQAAWLRIGETAIAAEYDPLTGTPRVKVGAGRAVLPNLALRWEALRWQGGSAPQLDLQAEIEPYLIAPLLARLQPGFGWGGDLLLAGRVNIRSAPSFVAEIEFGRRGGDLTVTDEAGVQALELTDLRIALDARDGVWHFTQALAGRTLGAMAGAATVRTDPRAIWPPADAPLQGVLEMRIADFGAWGAWAPAGWRLRGALHASASFGGTFGAAEYTGRIDGSGIGVRNLVEGIAIDDGELDIVLEGETARVRKAQARAGSGTLQLEGEATFGAVPALQLRLLADKALVLGRVDRRIVASGDLKLALAQRQLGLDGRLRVDQGLIDFSRGNAPGLAEDVTVTRAPTPGEEAAATLQRRSPIDTVAMQVALDLGPALRIRGRGLDSRLQGELTLSAPDRRLAAHGSINAAPGTYAAYNQKLQIERGGVTFSGPIDNPRLDILALRPNLDIRVGVAITGNVSAPRIALYSDPELADNDKLSWLILGRPPDSTSGADTALLQAAAMALLAGEGDGPGAALAKLNPLDTLSVRQTDGVVRDTVVTVGKQLSQRWYIGYERSLSETAGNWQLIYRIGQRFTVRLQAGVDNSIDFIWSWRWD